MRLIYANVILLMGRRNRDARVRATLDAKDGPPELECYGCALPFK